MFFDRYLEVIYIVYKHYIVGKQHYIYKIFLQVK